MSVNDAEAGIRHSPHRNRGATESVLERLLGDAPLPGERVRPKRLVEAMRYATLGGGKRFRPFLVVESAALFGVPRERSLMAGAALECIHCYSLVHDDLPAMDNDDLRRGRPTTHKKFDQATAILAGDSLLTLRLRHRLAGRDPSRSRDPRRARAWRSPAPRASAAWPAARCSISRRKAGSASAAQLGLADVEELQAMKTGALLRFGCLAGAILGEAKDAERQALDRFGAIVGEAFQIADDLLDVEGDPETVGKATGKDAGAHKATTVSILGVERAKQKLFGLIAEAETTLAPFGRAGRRPQGRRAVRRRTAGVTAIRHGRIERRLSTLL